jgi:glycosyltransferase involved in cell wall biosynthesis
MTGRPAAADPVQSRRARGGSRAARHPAADREPDVCLLLEGTYPYTQGGVSAWVHDLVCGMDELTFHAVSLLPGHAVPPRVYDPPPNLVGLTHVFVRALPGGLPRVSHADRLFAAIAEPLARLQSRGGMGDVAALCAALGPHRARLGRRVLPDSRPAWRLLLAMHEAAGADGSFLDYFWTWRCLHEAMYSVLLAPLPRARLYHTISTGYAGLMAVRARVETGRPALVTEHGIYTNERRVEIAMAEWLHEECPESLAAAGRRATLGDVWINTFISYARACYEACERIVTLHEGSQPFQIEDGAPPHKLRVIPNGVDVARFASVRNRAAPHPPTVALIARVVPIKDVKTFLRACALLRRSIPDLRAWVLGSAEADPAYAAECEALARHLGLRDVVTFHGQVPVHDYLPQVDVVVLTSISEAQPLVILEAGAAGIPSVATDVGSCRELILGRSSESPSLGPGGAVTPPADPAATARALAELLARPDRHSACSRAIRKRVATYYRREQCERAYRDLYRELREVPVAADGPAPDRAEGHAGGGRVWRA